LFNALRFFDEPKAGQIVIEKMCSANRFIPDLLLTTLS
jgi:hypothetical protein